MAHLLVVDDEAHVIRLLRLALERAGHEVEVAKNAAAALACLDRSSFDAMLTDITMPGMNGVELCVRVRQELGLELPIFVMTSRVEDEFRKQIGALDDIAFIEKPLSLRGIVARLAERLGGNDDEPKDEAGA